MTFPYGTTVSDMAEDLMRLLGEQSPEATGS
jgi:hypothetical protein